MLKSSGIVGAEFDLYVLDGDLNLEELPEGNALGCFATLSCASSGSCPASTAATLTTASTNSG